MLDLSYDKTKEVCQTLPRAGAGNDQPQSQSPVPNPHAEKCPEHFELFSDLTVRDPANYNIIKECN